MQKIESADGTTIAFDRLIMWEPPFSIDPDGPRRAAEYAARLRDLLVDDRRDDAMAHFMTMVGMPVDAIAGMRHSPYWQDGLSLAPTLAYDAEIMGDGTVPVRRLGEIAVPTLVLAGSRSPQFLAEAAKHAAAAIPGARIDVLAGQDHNVAGDALAAAVAAFSGR